MIVLRTDVSSECRNGLDFLFGILILGSGHASFGILVFVLRHLSYSPIIGYNIPYESLSI
jgi:hypothetical protein